MPKNIFVLVGPPTSGKTTQAIFLEETTRAHRIRGRDIVPELSFVLESDREIVPDGIFLPRLQEALENATNSSLIMDNIPRTPAQAKLLAEWADTNGVNLNVIRLDLNEDEVVDRATQRQVCSDCGESYHPLLKPARVEGICDQDSTRLIGRPGDKEAVLRKGFADYQNLTEALVAELAFSAQLYKIPAQGTVTDTAQIMFEQLGPVLFCESEMSQGYHRLRAVLERQGVRHLFISGMPVFLYGGRALMKDFDILVPDESIDDVALALKKPVEVLDSSVATTRFVDVAAGVEVVSNLAVKADGLTVPFTFESLWQEARTIRFLGLECQLMGIEDLIMFKAALGRFGSDDWGQHKDDLSDIEGLVGVQNVDWQKLASRAEQLGMKARLAEKLGIVNVTPGW